MNNSLFNLGETEEAPDYSARLQEREAQLVKIAGAIDSLRQNPDWQALKKSLFDGQVANLQNSLLSAGKKKELNLSEIYRLQGELIWAERYSNLEKFAKDCRMEIQNIRKQLHAN